MDFHISPPFHYGVYGVSLRSEIPLCLPEQSRPGLSQISLHLAEAEVFAHALVGAELMPCDDWYQYAHLADGSSYVSWQGLGEFLVSPDGTRIVCRRLAEASMESFQVYLLGQALSFALVKSGAEPLHGTAVVIQQEAICFLGGSGHGKSTLAASFLDAGHSLLTDDLLVLRPSSKGLDAFPGPPRIKLFPKVARRFMGSVVDGVPMNADSAKHVIPIAGVRRHAYPVPLRAIYVLAAPSEMRYQRKVRVETMAPREAFLALVGHTFNRFVTGGARLQRQLMEAAHWFHTVPVKKLSFPRNLARLPEVHAAILADCGLAAPLVKESAA